MTTPSLPPVIGTLEGGEACAGWFQRFVNRAASSRSHRVILLVMAIWMLNGFDLAMTVLAHQQGLLHEQNPVARGLLQGGTAPLMLFKLGLVLIGTYPLLRFRRVRIAELGALVVLVAYAMVSVRWSTCYELYALTASHGVHLAELEAVGGAPH